MFQRKPWIIKDKKKGYWTFQLQYFICAYVNWTFQLVYSLTVKSRLVAHFQILRKLMKEKFHAYVLWPLAKKTYKLNSRLIFCSQLYDISKLWMPSHRGLKLDGAIDDFAKPEGRKLVILLHNSTYITLAPHKSFKASWEPKIFFFQKCYLIFSNMGQEGFWKIFNFEGVTNFPLTLSSI